jgi:hypothetical protein
MVGKTARTTIKRLFHKAISNPFFHHVITVFPADSRAG